MIEIKKVTKLYNPQLAKPVTALKEVNLAFTAGELVCVLGKSGSGKSTLLNLLAGFDQPTTGKVMVEGKNLSDFTPIELADYRKDHVGFVFQDFQLLDHLNVFENVKIGLAMEASLTIEEKEKLVKDILAKVGLLNHKNHYPSELSGGQKQRVSIARALVKEPAVLIADEPTGALDSETSQEIMSLLKGISESGKLVIVVTHDEEYAQMASKIVTLRDGKVTDVSELKEPVLLNDSHSQEKNVHKRVFEKSLIAKLTWQKIKINRWRYILVSIGLVIGIASLGLALGLNNGLHSYITHINTKIIDEKKIILTKKGDLTSEDIFTLKKNKDITLVQDEYLLTAKDGKSVNLSKDAEFSVKSILPEEYQDEFAKPTVTEGRLPEDGKKEIALSPEIAKKLAKDNSTHSLIGQTISLKFLAMDDINHYPSRWDEQSLTVTGITESTLIGEEFAYVPYQTHKDITRRSRFIGMNDDIPTNSLSVYVKDKKTVDALYDRLLNDYDVTRPVDVLKELTTVFQNLNTIVFIAAMLILIISGIMIGIILYISVLERRREIGLFISVGATKGDIKKLFLAEAIFLGAIASVTGVSLSLAIKPLLDPIMMNMMSYPLYQPTILTCMLALMFGVLVSVIASFIPARNAANLLPIDLLRRN